MLNVDGKRLKNNHLFCQHLLVSSASMITELQLHRIPTILLAQRVPHRALASQVRTGGLPSILQEMALLIDPVHTMNQDREVLTVVVGGMKMGTQMVPIQAADAHQIGCHRNHRNTRRVDRRL